MPRVHRDNVAKEYDVNANELDVNGVSEVCLGFFRMRC